MTTEEHYAQAEKYLDLAGIEHDPGVIGRLLARAQVHATLATTSAPNN